MKHLETLNKILLSTSVVEEFYKEYKNSDFKNWFLNIVPEVEKCEKQQQDNPWHIYGTLDHILHSVEEINKQTINLDHATRRMLAYTMFYHDIGKPDCVLRRYSKAYGREVDSFFDHNIKSAEIAERSLKFFNFSENECEIIKKLVFMHDIFINISLNPTQNKFKRQLTKDVLQDIIDELNTVGNGAILINYLIMIARSDNLSQNPEMTADSLKILDAVQTMLNNNLKYLNSQTNIK